VPLLAYESCNLGSINLAHMIKRTPTTCEIDWSKLQQTIDVAMRFLDNVIEVNRLPFPQVEAAARTTRKVGLGVMGFAAPPDRAGDLVRFRRCGLAG
jgi:ribonucleoside-diphosphate reductase alpha chain